MEEAERIGGMCKQEQAWPVWRISEEAQSDSLVWAKSWGHRRGLDSQP